LVLNDRVRQQIEGKEDIKARLKVTENAVTTLAFLNFLKFFGGSMIILGIFFFVETSFNTNSFTIVFLAMGSFFVGSAIIWEDNINKKIKHDVY
jgi:drug/metabolite transporter superfamily protein YnfA